jgi:hypothetical protein
MSCIVNQGGKSRIQSHLGGAATSLLETKRNFDARDKLLGFNGRATALKD